MIEDDWIVVIDNKSKWKKMSMKLRSRAIDTRINNYKTFPYYEHDDIEVTDLDWNENRNVYYNTNTIDYIKHDLHIFINQVKLEMNGAFKIFIETM